MKNKYKLCVGLLTFCDDKKSKERFEIMKKCVDSLYNLKQEDVFIYVWDNNSSKNVKDFLLSRKDLFNEMYFSEKNLFDNVAINFLAKKAKDINAKYSCYLDDDIFFYRKDFLNDCFEFMNSNKDVNALRLLKYDFNKKEIYDKMKNHPNRDYANAQRHYNQITKNKLNWEYCGIIGQSEFYKNNWHFYTFPTICKTEIFDKLVPKEDCRPLQGVELFMMKKYHELGGKKGVLNLGAATHLGYKKINSSRLQNENQPGAKGFPVIKWETVYNEMNNITDIKKELL
jgi:hypothetical protein